MPTEIDETVTDNTVLSSSIPEKRLGRLKRPKAWPFVLPALIAILLILLYPLGYNVWISLHVDQLSPDDGKFVGFENYWDVLAHGELLSTIGRTLVFTFGSLLLQIVVGVPASLALEFFPRASKVIRPLLLAPWAVPGVAVAAIWLAILNPITGLANRLLSIVGIPPVDWLSQTALAMFCLIVANTWRAAPYWILMVSAGLKMIPGEVLEAARVDGAPYWRVVWHIILPDLRPVLSATAVLTFIWTLNYFELAYLLTNGGPQEATTTLPLAIWQLSLEFNRYDQGAAYSVATIALLSIAVVMYLRLTRKSRQEDAA